MTKIINGIRYSTDAATSVGNYNNGLSGSDFNFLDETLYKTNSGNYFLHGEGGAMTEYSVRIGDSTCDGARIVPLSRDEAFAWAQENLRYFTVEAEFGELIKEA